MGIEYKDNKKCRLVVYAGSDAYGKPQRFYKTVSYTSPRNAEKQYRAFEREVLDGLTNDPSTRISTMMDEYIASRKRRGIRTTTITGYNVIKTRIIDTLGDPIAAKVTKKMIDDWISTLDEKYEVKTIRNTVQFLSSCYERYIDLEQVRRNPCRHAELPEKKPKERKILSKDDIIPFYNALCMEKDHQLDFVVAMELALFCGLRRSEIAALRESDIDMFNHTVHVSNARIMVGKKYVEEGTKTARSNRVLSLPDFVFDDIMKLISLHAERARTDQNLPFPEYLILGECGEPIYPGCLLDKLKRFEKKYKLPDVNLHGLRHTYASMLKWLGRDLIEISPQLGHSQQSTTLDIYMHLFQDATDLSKDIAADLDKFVKRG